MSELTFMAMNISVESLTNYIAVWDVRINAFMAMNMSVDSLTNYTRIENTITGTRLGFLTEMKTQ